MRYFFENLFTLQPRNLIPEVVWMGGALYFLVIVACFHSILVNKNLRARGKVFFVIIVLLPFIGPVTYACYNLKISDSTLKELWHSHRPDHK
jgi:hypothetical protein